MKTQSEQTRSEASGGRSRRLPVLAAVAGVAAVAVVGVVLAVDRMNPGPEADAVELSLPDAGGVMGSCLPFTVEYLADMSPAFAGTATEVTGNRVVLRVDRWYAGGSAPEVVLDYPEGAHVALNGVIDFREGGQYLITAEDGTVNLCGYSGEATPELRSAFETAF
jgi:hypothetical protein